MRKEECQVALSPEKESARFGCKKLTMLPLSYQGVGRSFFFHMHYRNTMRSAKMSPFTLYYGVVKERATGKQRSRR